MFIFGSKATTVNGTNSCDVIIGNNHNIVLDGGKGNDIIVAGPQGDNNIHGGKGNDIMVGGAGSDTFSFNYGDGKHDQIFNFKSGVDHAYFQMSPLQFSAEIHGNDLVIKYGTIGTIGPNTQQVTIHGYGKEYHAEDFNFPTSTPYNDHSVVG